MEKFAARDRAYICTYNHLDQMNSDLAGAAAGAAAPHTVKQELFYNEIEMLMKAFKRHRCALDFDRGFVNSHLREVKKTRCNAETEDKL
jgi:hypothetical protein